jgi:hypothetical protein
LAYAFTAGVSQGKVTMHIARAIQSSALSLALVACVQTSSTMESPSLMPAPINSFLADGPATTAAGLDQARLADVGFNVRHSTVHGGYFVDADQIAAMHPHTIADVFRHVPVLLESPFSYRNRLLIGPTPCFVTYVDGLIRRGKGPSNLDTFMRVQDVIGAEVYPSGEQPPPPFAGSSADGSCTTVAIWTRLPHS